MAGILVRPPELRSKAAALRASAERIKLAVENLDSQLNSLSDAIFEGNRASTLRSRYLSSREVLLQTYTQVIAFAVNLEQAAQVFEQSDYAQSSSSTDSNGLDYQLGYVSYDQIPVAFCVAPGTTNYSLISANDLNTKVGLLDYDFSTNKNDFAPSLGFKYALIDQAVYKRESDDGFDVFGAEAGLEGKAGDKGVDFGAYAGAYAVKGDVDGVIGDDKLGITGGVGTELLSAEAFAGIRHNSIGAVIGGKLCTVDGKVGVNIAGLNVNLIGEVGLKAELGVSVGAKTEFKAPFFSLGVSFGEAEAD